MKILVVHNYYPVRGGEDSVVEEEWKMLEGAGHSVLPFYMFTYERGLRDFLLSALCVFWNPMAYRRMRCTLRKEKPDVVHVHNTFPLISPSVYWACRKERVPVVQTLHNYRLICANGMFLRKGRACEDCSGRRFGWPAIQHCCYRGSLAGSVLLVVMQWVHRVLGSWSRGVTRYIALTDFAKSRFVQSGLLPDEQISVKPNFIQDVLSAKKALPRKKQAVFVGRLCAEKGSSLLIQAWIQAFEQSQGLDGYELLLVGDGPLRDEAEALCKGHAADYRIRFEGMRPREEVMTILQSSRFMVLPSIWYEGFPMTIVESFACGTPILSAAIGNMLSIVEEQRTGLFFEPGDIDDLADRIVWAVTHEAEMLQMGQKARMQYEQHYTPDKNLVRLMRIYEETVS
jgi:glycosyltransferase involved in cell wall biosynthesis